MIALEARDRAYVVSGQPQSIRWMIDLWQIQPSFASAWVGILSLALSPGSSGKRQRDQFPLMTATILPFATAFTLLEALETMN